MNPSARAHTHTSFRKEFVLINCACVCVYECACDCLHTWLQRKGQAQFVFLHRIDFFKLQMCGIVRHWNPKTISYSTIWRVVNIYSRNHFFLLTWSKWHTILWTLHSRRVFICLVSRVWLLKNEVPVFQLWGSPTCFNGRAKLYEFHRWLHWTKHL